MIEALGIALIAFCSGFICGVALLAAVLAWLDRMMGK